jgi:hypothetical protein
VSTARRRRVDTRDDGCNARFDDGETTSVRRWRLRDDNVGETTTMGRVDDGETMAPGRDDGETTTTTMGRPVGGGGASTTARRRPRDVDGRETTTARRVDDVADPRWVPRGN